MLSCCWIRCCNSARPIALYWRLQHLITPMQAHACYNQPQPALPPIWLPPLPLLAGGVGSAGFSGGAANSAAGAGGVQGRQRQRWQGLDGVGVGFVRGYWHGTTGESGTEAVWVTNLQDKCLAAGRPPAPDFLRMLSWNAVRESQSSVQNSSGGMALDFPHNNITLVSVDR